MARTLNIALSLALTASTVVGCSSDDDGGGGGTSGSGGSAGAGGSGGGGTSGGGTSGGDSGGKGLTCDTACPGVSGAGCMKGPPKADLCTLVCNNIAKGGTGITPECTDAIKAMLACLTPTSTYACASDGNVTSPGCESEFAAAAPCFPQL